MECEGRSTSADFSLAAVVSFSTMAVVAAPEVAAPWARHEFFRLLSGYIVWGLTGAVIAVPEIWAAVDGDSVKWPTISGTVGYIQYWHTWVAVLVIAVLVWGAFHAVRYTPGPTERRTPAGRLTFCSGSSFQVRSRCFSAETFRSRPFSRRSNTSRGKRAQSRSSSRQGSLFFWFISLSTRGRR
jgi:hypothetical protein